MTIDTSSTFDPAPRPADLPRVAPMPLYVGAIVIAVLAYFGRGPIAETLAQFHLAELANPYWIPGQALLFYVLTPLSSFAISLFFMTPGLLLAATYGREKTLAHWLLAGFAASTGLIVLATTVVQLGTGTVLKGNGFYLLVLMLVIGAMLLAMLQTGRGEKTRVSLDGEGAELCFAAVFALGIIIALSPKFYWENFSGDGSGSLQFARNFIHTLWPFWAPEAGTIQKAPGITSMFFVIPESWYVRLIGENEYAVRIPHMLYLFLLFPVLTALIRWGRDRIPHVSDLVLLGLALLVYTLSVIYSGGYNPYFGDSPMPAVRETLAMVVFMGYIYAFLEDRRLMMLVLALMAHTSIPTGGLWLLLWPMAVFAIWRPIPWGRLIYAGVILVIAAAVSVIVPKLIELVGMPFPGGEFNAKAVVDRLRYVAFIDWQRFAFPSVPVGILPALFVFTWKYQDRLSRALTLVAVVFFLFFYAQGYRVLLHHFIPVMMPLLVIFWRSPLLERANLAMPLRLAAVVGLVLSTWIAWPKEMTLHSFDRQIGAHIATEGPRFQDGDTRPGDRFPHFEPEALDTAHILLGKLFPIGWREQDSRERFFGAPLVWYYYSEFEKADDQVVNYVIKPEAEAVPEDGRLFASHDGYGLYIRDEALYETHYATKLTPNTGAPIFVVSRDDIFGKGATCCDRVVIDLVGIAKSVLGLKGGGDNAAADNG